MKTYSFELDDKEADDLDYNIMQIQHTLALDSPAECLVYLIKIATNEIFLRATALMEQAEGASA